MGDSQAQAHGEEEDKPSRALVDFFAVVGLDPTTGLDPFTHAAMPDLDHLCFPQGLRFQKQEDNRRITFHTFVMTRDNGDRIYGSNLIFYERVDEQDVLSAMKVLEDMHRAQLECTYHATGAARRVRSLSSSTGSAGGGGPRRTPPPAFDPHRHTLYAPKAICILSQFPAVACFEQYLRQLYLFSQTRETSSAELGACVENVLFHVPLPPPGKTLKFQCLHPIVCHRPPPDALPLFEYSMRRLFSLLSPPNVVQLVTCLLLEQQTIIRSQDYELLVLVAECATALMYPFLWQHVYVPILPANALHFIEAPVPFIMGLHADLDVPAADDAPCIVDVGRASVTFPEDIPAFPNADKLAGRLHALVRASGESSGCANLLVAGGAKALHGLLSGQSLPKFPNNPGTMEDFAFTAAVRHTFLSAWADVLSGYETYLILPNDPEAWLQSGSVDDTVFDKLSFLSDQPSTTIPFLTRFLETQIFAYFLDQKISTLIKDRESMSCFDHVLLARTTDEATNGGGDDDDDDIDCSSDPSSFTHFLDRRSFDDDDILKMLHSPLAHMTAADVHVHYEAPEPSISPTAAAAAAAAEKGREQEGKQGKDKGGDGGEGEEGDGGEGEGARATREGKGSSGSSGGGAINQSKTREPRQTGAAGLKGVRRGTGDQGAPADLLKEEQAEGEEEGEEQGEGEGREKHEENEKKRADRDELGLHETDRVAESNSGSGRGNGLGRQLPTPPKKETKYKGKGKKKRRHAQRQRDIRAKDVVCGRFAFPVPRVPQRKLQQTPALWPSTSGGSSATRRRTDRRRRALQHTGSDPEMIQSRLAAARQQRQALIRDVKLEESAPASSQERFAAALVMEAAQKVKKMVRASLSLQGPHVQHVQQRENTMVAALCDLLERAFRHGLQRQCKAPMWQFMLNCLKTGALPQDVQVSIRDVAAMPFLRSAAGRGRAWVRLMLEQKRLSEALEACFGCSAVLVDMYKPYAFLQQFEARMQLVSHLLSLTTLDLACFSSNYPPATVAYTVTIRTANSFRAGTSSFVWIKVNGDLASTDLLPLGKSPTFNSGGKHVLELQRKNMGVVKSVMLCHDNSGFSPNWTVDRVTVDNGTTHMRTTLSTDGRRRFEKQRDTGRSHITLEPVRSHTEEAQQEKASEPSPSPGDALPEQEQMVVQSLCETFATAINRVVKYFYQVDARKHDETTKLQLLLGRHRVMGTARSTGKSGTDVQSILAFGDADDDVTQRSVTQSLEDVLLHGYRRMALFKSPRSAWDVIERCRKQLDEAELQSDARGLFHHAYRSASSHPLPKHARFEWFVCYGAQHHVLHVWFDILHDFAKTSSVYSQHALMRHAPTAATVADMLRYLVDVQLNIIESVVYVEEADHNEQQQQQQQREGRWVVKTAPSTQQRRQRKKQQQGEEETGKAGKKEEEGQLSE